MLSNSKMINSLTVVGHFDSTDTCKMCLVIARWILGLQLTMLTIWFGQIWFASRVPLDLP